MKHAPKKQPSQGVQPRWSPDTPPLFRGFAARWSRLIDNPADAAAWFAWLRGGRRSGRDLESLAWKTEIGLGFRLRALLLRQLPDPTWRPCDKYPGGPPWSNDPSGNTGLDAPFITCLPSEGRRFLVDLIMTSIDWIAQQNPRAPCHSVNPTYYQSWCVRLLLLGLPADERTELIKRWQPRSIRERHGVSTSDVLEFEPWLALLAEATLDADVHRAIDEIMRRAVKADSVTQSSPGLGGAFREYGIGLEALAQHWSRKLPVAPELYDSQMTFLLDEAARRGVHPPLRLAKLRHVLVWLTTDELKLRLVHAVIPTLTTIRYREDEASVKAILVVGQAAGDADITSRCQAALTEYQTHYEAERRAREASQTRDAQLIEQMRR